MRGVERHGESRWEDIDCGRLGGLVGAVVVVAAAAAAAAAPPPGPDPRAERRVCPGSRAPAPTPRWCCRS